MRHILIVEDNDLVSGALRVLVEREDRTVAVAGSVAEAVAAASTEPPELVLLDLTLPDGDGLNVIRQLPSAGGTKFVALTGHDDQAIVRRCLDAGCIEVLVKPVPARALIARVDEWLADRE